MLSTGQQPNPGGLKNHFGQTPLSWLWACLVATTSQSASRTCGRKSEEKQRSQRSLHCWDDLKQVEQHVLYFLSRADCVLFTATESEAIQWQAWRNNQNHRVLLKNNIFCSLNKHNKYTHRQQQLNTRLSIANSCAEQVGLQTAWQTDRQHRLRPKQQQT